MLPLGSIDPHPMQAAGGAAFVQPAAAHGFLTQQAWVDLVRHRAGLYHDRILDSGWQRAGGMR